MSTSPHTPTRQSEIVSYRDSVKVLRAIREIIDQNSEKATQPSDGPTGRGKGRSKNDSTDIISIREVLDNAPTTSKIITRQTADIPVDSFSQRPSDGNGGGSSFPGRTPERPVSGPGSD